MSKSSTNKIWVIVPAAGSGRRMRTATAKQYLHVNGRTLLETTLRLLLAQARITEIVVTTGTEDKQWHSLACAKLPRIVSVVGGATRAHSVYNGLLALQGKAGESDWVLVHDAARPCLKAALLDRLITKLQHDPVGGILALRVKDTLKLSDSQNQRIRKTLDRSSVWQAQTPQMFRFGLLINALECALNANLDITDEASAMELAGYQPRLIEGDARNLKVTTPEDLQLAEFLLSAESTVLK